MAVKFDLSLILIFFGFKKVEGIGRFEGYLTIIIVIVLYYLSAFVGCALKKEYQKHLKKMRNINLIFNQFEQNKPDVK